MKILKILGQIFTCIIVFGSGILLIEFNIPGHKDFTDADQFILLITYIIFFSTSVGLVINSILFYRRKQWKRYRVMSVLGILLTMSLLLTIRPITMNIFYGNVLHTISEVEEESEYVNIRLFENGKFISKTYDATYNIENAGIYTLTDDELILNFKDDKSDYLGTRYRIFNDSLICKDCKYEIKLIKN